jgi:hypothetical protein
MIRAGDWHGTYGRKNYNFISDLYSVRMYYILYR